MLPAQRELAALKFIDGLSAHLRDVRDPDKALRHALRDTRDFFAAAEACVATLRPARSTSRPVSRVVVVLPLVPVMPTSCGA